MEKSKQNGKYSLVECINAVPLGDQKVLRRNLSEALGISITNRPSYSNYVNGRSRLSLQQAFRIQEIFDKWNITCPWNKTEKP